MMKISKIMAGVAAMAMVASMTVATASAADTDYLYLVQGSWNGNAPTDSVEGTVKFTDTVAKGACDLNNWDTGAGKFNGEWTQFMLTSDDLSSDKVTFKIVADDASTWEYHELDETKTDDENAYTVFLTLGHTELLSQDTFGNPDGAATGDYIAGTGEWEYTYDFSDLTVDGENLVSAEGKNVGKLAANEDGTYTLGFNIQVGHVCNAKVTGTIEGDNLYKGADDSSSTAGGDSSSTAGGDSSSSAAGTDDKNSSTTGSDSNSKDDTTSGGSTTSGSGTTGNGGTTSAGTTSTGDNTENSDTGATAGIALAGIALAGAAIVAAKRK